MSKLCDKCTRQDTCTHQDELAQLQEEFYDYVVNRSELSKFNTSIFGVNIALVCEDYLSAEWYKDLKNYVIS